MNSVESEILGNETISAGFVSYRMNRQILLKFQNIRDRTHYPGPFEVAFSIYSFRNRNFSEEI